MLKGTSLYPQKRPTDCDAQMRLIVAHDAGSPVDTAIPVMTIRIAQIVDLLDGT
jgi:hypothetical protein